MKLLDDSYAAYINLDSRQDRREHMETQLTITGLSAERVRAMPWTGYRSVFTQAQVQVMLDRTPGAIGCWASQVSVMQEALLRDKHAFVMEDDLIFCSDLHERLAILEAFTTKHEWDVLWLGGTFHADAPVWHPELGTDWQRTDFLHVVRTFGAWSTYCYIVNRSSISRIITALDDLMPTSIGIDEAFIRLQPRLNAFAFVPGCVKQRDDRSDIGDGDTIFSNFHKLGPHWFQDQRGDFDPRTLPQ